MNGIEHSSRRAANPQRSSCPCLLRWHRRQHCHGPDFSRPLKIFLLYLHVCVCACVHPQELTCTHLICTCGFSCGFWRRNLSLPAHTASASLPGCIYHPPRPQVLDFNVYKFIAVSLLSTNFKVPSRIVIISVIVDLVPGLLEKEQWQANQSCSEMCLYLVNGDNDCRQL